jgi:hypothetical protein
MIAPIAGYTNFNSVASYRNRLLPLVRHRVALKLSPFVNGSFGRRPLTRWHIFRTGARPVMSTPAEYKDHAAECVQAAGKAESNTHKALFLMMAEAWIKLADQVEGRSPERAEDTSALNDALDAATRDAVPPARPDGLQQSPGTAPASPAVGRAQCARPSVKRRPARKARVCLGSD